MVFAQAGGVHDEAIELQKIREWSNRNLFTCDQISQLLKRFRTDKSRVELMVTVFARTLDWHGFSNLVLLLSLPAQVGNSESFQARLDYDVLV